MYCLNSSIPKYSFDVNTSTFFKKDAHNYINVLGIEQLNTLEDTSLLDLFLSKGNMIEPHYHQHAAELLYCISGSVTVSMLNPNTKELHHYPITAGQVANVPQGWWHYMVATADHTHFLGIFNAPTPEVILGSDILTLTPPKIMADAYCIDEKTWKKAIAPVEPSMIIGPPKDCDKTHHNHVTLQQPNYDDTQHDRRCPYTYQQPFYEYY